MMAMPMEAVFRMATSCIFPHWNIEFAAGIGYVRFEYDKAPFPAGREVAGSYRNDYFGPTKLGISIMYIIK